jgi:hypothetical protein
MISVVKSAIHFDIASRQLELQQFSPNDRYTALASPFFDYSTLSKTSLKSPSGCRLRAKAA